MSVNKNQISNQLQSRGQFAQIPNEIYKVTGLSNTARSIWIYLASEGPGWQSSKSNIARNMEISVPTVRNALEELEKLNMIISTPHDQGTDFELVSSDKWVVTWKPTVQAQPSTTKFSASFQNPNKSEVIARQNMIDTLSSKFPEEVLSSLPTSDLKDLMVAFNE